MLEPFDNTHIVMNQYRISMNYFSNYFLKRRYTTMRSFRESRSPDPVEIIPGKLYFSVAQQVSSGAPSSVPKGSLCYWLDQDLVYEPFCADFGPCNLGHTWRFCERLTHLLKECVARKLPLYLLVGPHPHKRANAAVLIGVYSVIYLNKQAEEAYAPLKNLEPFVRFRDASCGVPTFTLGVDDIIRGIQKAKEVGFIQWHLGEAFDIQEYEHYEQVENGDLNWIVPGKLMAFSGPAGTPTHFGDWRTFTPEDYIQYFRKKKVSAVVRLNKRMYEANRFTAHGIQHHDLYFPDGTCPSEPIMHRFLEIVENEPNALAIHCKAGLGRTGVLICCYMIKHYGFTAEEAMSYIRICRPGSVIGPQQHYLTEHEPGLLREGRRYRTQQACCTSISYPPSSPQNGRKVLNIVATSRSTDILANTAQENQITGHGQSPLLRRSPRLSSPPASRSSGIIGELDVTAEANEVKSSKKVDEADDKDFAPQSPMNKLSYATKAAIHVHAKDPVSTAIIGKGITEDAGDACEAHTPTNAQRIGNAPPPSTSKRLLAPNGQPRKIPLAMDFDSVATAFSMLEDRDLHLDSLEDSHLGKLPSNEDDSNWTVSSTPVPDGNYSATSRVGAFAVAAGRGATAFVEAFRSAVSAAHRDSYRQHAANRRTA